MLKGVGQTHVHVSVSDAVGVELQGDLEVGDGVRAEHQLETVHLREHVAAKVLGPVALAAAASQERLAGLAQPRDEEGAGARGRVEHRHEHLICGHFCGQVETVALRDLGPCGGIRDAHGEAESFAQHLVHRPHHEVDHRLGRVEGPGVGAHLAVVGGEELLVEVDDRVAALRGGAELVEDRLDVAGPQVGDELVEAAAREVEHAGLVVDLLEERLEERIGQRHRGVDRRGAEVLRRGDAARQQPVDERLGAHIGEPRRVHVGDQLRADGSEHGREGARSRFGGQRFSDLISQVAGAGGPADGRMPGPASGTG